MTPIRTVSITSITTATASPNTAVNAATGEIAGAGHPWLGFTHGNPPPVVFVVIESLDRSVPLGIGVHLDETESLAASHVTVLDDLCALYGAEWGEPLL